MPLRASHKRVCPSTCLSFLQGYLRLFNIGFSFSKANLHKCKHKGLFIYYVITDGWGGGLPVETPKLYNVIYEPLKGKSIILPLVCRWFSLQDLNTSAPSFSEGCAKQISRRWNSWKHLSQLLNTFSGEINFMPTEDSMSSLDTSTLETWAWEAWKKIWSLTYWVLLISMGFKSLRHQSPSIWKLCLVSALSVWSMTRHHSTRWSFT